jgi:hypothetical protein
MRRSMVSSLTAGACLLWACSANAAEGIQWAKSYDAALRQAKASNKLVMADFYTDW